MSRHCVARPQKVVGHKIDFKVKLLVLVEGTRDRYAELEVSAHDQRCRSNLQVQVV